MDAKQPGWYAMRVTYCRELRLKALLDEAKVPCFIPMCWRTQVRRGVRKRVVVPAIHNLCFVRSTRERIDEALELLGDNRWVSYVWDRKAHAPIVVPDKAMEDFITVSNSMLEDVVYLREVNPALREGMRVRVTGGAFKGVEGKVVRIRKSRRVLVELPGMLAVATTYVQPAFLEAL